MAHGLSTLGSGVACALNLASVGTVPNQTSVAGMWGRFRSRPSGSQALALVAVIVVMLGVAKLATVMRKKTTPASAGARAAAPTTTARTATTTTATTATTVPPAPTVSPLLVAGGTLETHWTYLQGAAGIPTTCDHPGYQIGVTNDLGQTMAIAAIQVGSPKRVAAANGTLSVSCVDSYTVTVAAAPAYTFSVTLRSDAAKQRAKQVVTLAVLRQRGAPALSATEG